MQQLSGRVPTAYDHCEAVTRIARVMKMHPNSLANLTPWPAGVSGNPHGRAPIGLSYQEYLNTLDTHGADGVAKYDQPALEQIRADPKQCRAKRAAAADLLDMARTDYDRATPMRANVIDRICDRTTGKPIQALMIQHARRDDPDVLTEQMRQMLARDPELCRVLGDQAPVDVLPGADEAEDEAGDSAG